MCSEDGIRIRLDNGWWGWPHVYIVHEQKARQNRDLVACQATFPKRRAVQGLIPLNGLARSALFSVV